MEKEFVPYKQALALKALRFNEPFFGYWKSKNWLIQEKTRTDGYTHADQECSAPIFQQVFRWFREKYDLFCEIQIDRTAEPKFCFDIFQYGHFGNYDEIRIGEWYLYRTQEEAELECLKKLIEIVKRK